MVETNSIFLGWILGISSGAILLFLQHWLSKRDQRKRISKIFLQELERFQPLLKHCLDLVKTIMPSEKDKMVELTIIDFKTTTFDGLLDKIGVLDEGILMSLMEFYGHLNDAQYWKHRNHRAIVEANMLKDPIKTSRNLANNYTISLRKAIEKAEPLMLQLRKQI